AGVYAALADVELRDGRLAQAVDTLRQGVKELPEAADLLLLLADLLLDGGQRSEAEAVIDRLRGFRPPPVRVAYLEARVRMAQGQWDEAIRLLEGVRPQVAAVAAWASQVDICLGQCHEKLGEVEPQ